MNYTALEKYAATFTKLKGTGAKYKGPGHMSNEVRTYLQDRRSARSGGLMKWVKNNPLKTTAGALGGAFSLHHIFGGDSSGDTKGPMYWDGNRNYGSDSGKSPYSAS